MKSHRPSLSVTARALPVATRWRIASSVLLAAAACLAVGSARADESPDLQGKAVAGQVADVSSTAVGLAMGAAEANPLGILTLGVKAIAYKQIQEAPAVDQPAMWSAYGAFGWGAAANNVCVIAAIATGGAAAALCPLIGLATGMTTWNADEERRNRATFDAICDEQKRMNPNLICTYTPPAKS